MAVNAEEVSSDVESGGHDAMRCKYPSPRSGVTIDTFALWSNKKLAAYPSPANRPFNILKYHK